MRPDLLAPWRGLLSALVLSFVVVVESRSAAEPARESGATAQSEWTQWRGAARDARASGAAPWPDGFRGLSTSWRVPLEPGYSGPIVAKDRVFIAETVEERHERVRALDRRTGAVIWEAQWEGALKVPFFARRNGDWIRSTPAYDGHRLYIAGMRDVLVALDAATGSELWRIDFVDRFKTPLPSFGFVCSPLVDGNAVYVQAGASFVKVDAARGDIVWRTLTEDGGMMDSAFSSPVIATLGGVRQVLVQTREKLAGVDPDTGAVLWSHSVPSFRGMNILTPVPFGDAIFTSTYKNKSFLYNVRRDSSGFSASEAWTNKAQGYMSSPIVHDGHAYLHLANGRLACIDLQTGNERWRTSSFGQYWSMVANGDRVLALDQRGELLMFRATPEKFDLWDRVRVSDDETWGHLAVAGEELFIRELNGITAFRWSQAAATEAQGGRAKKVED